MKTEKPKNPEYKKAYFVRSWGDKIINGVAFVLTHEEYGYPMTKAYFIEEGKENPNIVDAKQVVFAASHADSLLEREINSRKEYYKKQLKEAQDELNRFN